MSSSAGKFLTLMLEKLTKAQSAAAFLDIDGTLLDIAPTPDSVVMPARLPELLYELWMRLDGALALVSGRALDDIDRLFSPFRFPAAGGHGCEIREPNGCVLQPTLEATQVSALHEAISTYEFPSPGVLVEYKPFGVAIHYRLNPAAEPEVTACVEAALAKLGTGFALQRGKCVQEIKPVGISKGSAIRHLMDRWPFKERHPFFIGDDVTDESGFEVVNLAGGTSIRVGESTSGSLARYAVSTPAAVHALLEAIVAGDK
jgi:trehalose 6-phosphate phosphatase